MGWAFRQKVPPIPKMVLLALADQTDETTGRVCYGKTDIKHIAAKASVGARSVYRYIGALIRNGYMLRESGKEKGKPSTYWLCLDRPLAKDIAEFQWVRNESDADQEIDDMPDRHTPYNTFESPTVADPLCQQVADQDSLDRPKNISVRARESEPLPPSGFSRQAQDLERNRFQAKQQETQPKSYFVIEGTRAWEAWLKVKRKETGVSCWNLTTTAIIDGKQRRGWWFPSLFPPTGPPETLLTPEDERYIAKHGL